LTTRLASIGTVIVYLLVALALVYIVYSVVQYFIKGKEGESRGAAGMQILWGIVGLAIILSLWGLVNVLLQTFGTTTTNAPTGKLPQTNFLTTGSGSTP
jgi:predicted PurR-regulated permease PerM